MSYKMFSLRKLGLFVLDFVGVFIAAKNRLQVLRFVLSNRLYTYWCNRSLLRGLPAYKPTPVKLETPLGATPHDIAYAELYVVRPLITSITTSTPPICCNWNTTHEVVSKHDITHYLSYYFAYCPMESAELHDMENLYKFLLRQFPQGANFSFVINMNVSEYGHGKMLKLSFELQRYGSILCKGNHDKQLSIYCNEPFSFKSLVIDVGQDDPSAM